VLKAIFFDAAGTIFETREPAGHIYARIAAKHGLRADDAVVNDGFRHAFATTPPFAFGTGHRPEALRRFEREWWSGVVRKSFEGLGEFDDFDRFFAELFAYFGDPGNWAPVPEAHPTLQRLKDMGLRLGVISNFDYRLYRILDGLDLRRYFDSITISSEAGFAKPSPLIFAAALEAVGVEPGEAAHVGDSETMDFEGAQGAGLRAILIDGTLDDAESVDASGSRIASLASLNKVMRLLWLTS